MPPPDIQQQLPDYLTKGTHEAVVECLRDYENKNLFTQKHKNELLQGDGWRGFTIINFNNGNRGSILGIVVSNSCDVDINNKRDIPSKITFAPLVKLSEYGKLLKSIGGLSDDKIVSKFNSIRSQHVSSIFYLPQGQLLDDEYIALLDDLHCMPLASFSTSGSRSKMFTLSQTGFYLFILKLSVHFCRFQEGLDRGP